MFFVWRVRFEIWRLGVDHRQFTKYFIRGNAKSHNLKTPREVAEFAIRQLPLNNPEAFFPL